MSRKEMKLNPLRAPVYTGLINCLIKLASYVKVNKHSQLKLKSLKIGLTHWSDEDTRDDMKQQLSLDGVRVERQGQAKSIKMTADGRLRYFKMYSASYNYEMRRN